MIKISNKLYLGIHLKINNFSTLIEALKKTKKLGGNVLQIYMGNNRLTTLREKLKFNRNEIIEIKEFLQKNNMKLFIHAILSLNYCNDPLSKRNQWGIDNLVYDMNICKKIGSSGVIIHMGTYKTNKIDISYENCIVNFINSLIIVLNKTKKIPILLETPVNRKNIIGGTIEGLIDLYKKIPFIYLKRIKICIDTQHIFASGYNIRNMDIVKDYFEKINREIGLKNLLLIHLNDSKKEFDSRINRHAPIGKGFIFSENQDSLKYIVNFAYKNNISLLLETEFENYEYELKYLKSLIQNNFLKGGKIKKDIKKLVLKIFNEILLYHESLGKKGNQSTKFRIDSYKKAIKSIENYKGKIYNSNNVIDLPYIGKSFCNKINEISDKGTLSFYDNIKRNDKNKSLRLFQKIWGIGPEFAHKIIEKNIFTISQLKKAIKNKNIELSKQQLIGLKYYKDLNKKIPRNEITLYTSIIKKLIEKDNIKIYNAGSYRLGKKFSNDIDLIISFNKKKKEHNLESIKNIFYDKLLKKNIIIETLSSGLEKCMYIVKLPNNFYRKIDVIFIEDKYLPWYLLYFGSSRIFSKKIRKISSDLGYKLNEKGLFNKKTGNRIQFNPKNEKDIFDYLKIEYVEPEKRL